MAKIESILKPIFRQLNIDATTPEAIALLSADVNVDDNIVSNVTASLNSLVTIESAKNNPAVAAHFKKKHFSEALDKIDQKIENMIADLELSPETAAAITGIQDSYLRMEALQKAVKTQVDSKVAAASKGEKADLLKKIEELNSEVLKSKSTFEQEKAALLNNHKATLTDFQLAALFNGKKWANEKAGEEMNRKFAMAALKEALQKEGALLSFDDTTGLTLLDSKAPDLPFHKDNQPVKLEDFVSKFLADNALVQTTAPAKASEQPTFNSPPVHAAPGAAPIYNDSVIAAMAAAEAQAKTS